jgi:uncharacterized protein
MSDIQHVLIAPRWAGSSQHDWYPWLKASLGATHPGVVVEVLDLPEPSKPDPEVWAAAIAARLLDFDRRLPAVMLVGHSVGCQGVLRALGALPADAQVGGLLMVAGWWTIDAPWDSIQPWLTPPPHLARARAQTPWTDVLLSDNDPFTADATANAAQWRDTLDASVSILPGLKHFNGAQEPDVLAAISRRL